MKIEDLIKEYPSPSFTEVFLAKEGILEASGATKEQIARNKDQFYEYLEYDKIISSLKECLSDNNEYIPTVLLIQSTPHFQKINDLATALSRIFSIHPTGFFSIFLKEIQDSNQRINAANRNVSNKTRTIQTVSTADIDNLNRLLQRLSPQKNFQEEESKIANALKAAEGIIQNQEKYEKAAAIANNWIETQGQAAATSFDNKAEIFGNKAEEHSFEKEGQFWLWGGVLSGIVAALLAILFIILESDISLGAALMRLSILLMISYFTFFSLSQFIINKKLYETYKFKSIALKTMEELIKSFSEPKDSEVILNKAISIIFNEPTFKETNNLQEKLLQEAIEIIKRK